MTDTETFKTETEPTKPETEPVEPDTEPTKPETEQTTPPVAISSDEVSTWNWGAFMMPLQWSFGNHTYLPLLAYIPVFGIFWAFVNGFKATSWAWAKTDLDAHTFKSVQASWNRAGLFMFVILVGGVALYFTFLFFVFSAFAGDY